MFWTVSDYEEHCNKNEILKEHIPVLKEFYNENIFCIEYHTESKNYEIRERCDDHFSTTLTAIDCKKLSQIFSAIANDIENQNNK